MNALAMLFAVAGLMISLAAVERNAARERSRDA